MALLALGLASGAGPARAAQGAGAEIATNGTSGGVPACTGCHGAHGEGNADAGFPRLAGLSTPYLKAQLAGFGNGQRGSSIMAPIARMLRPDEVEAVSAYFAALPGPALPKIAPATAAPGAALALNGRWSDGIPACTSCHGPDGVGVGAAFPPIAGQPATYVTAQLKAWQEGKRPPGPLGLMGAVARRLTASDIMALGDWVATLSGGSGP